MNIKIVVTIAGNKANGIDHNLFFSTKGTNQFLFEFVGYIEKEYKLNNRFLNNINLNNFLNRKIIWYN
jgi:hypothetical protein